MRIIGIISSPRLNGNTATLVREALKGAAAEGAEVQEIFLANYNIKFCTGCSACMSTGQCPLVDDFESLKQLVYQADGFIFGSPTYAASPNAIMKNFMERLGMFERFTSSGLGGKYAVGISTASSSGAKKVANALVNFVQGSIFKRGYVSGTLGVAVKGGDIHKHPKFIAQAHALGRKIVRDIRAKKSYALQNLSGRILNTIVFKPMFAKVAQQHKDGHLKAVYLALQQQGVIS